MTCPHSQPFEIISRAKPNPLRCRHCGAQSRDEGATWTGPSDAPLAPTQAIPVYGAADPETLARREEARRALQQDQGDGDWVTRL